MWQSSNTWERQQQIKIREEIKSRINTGDFASIQFRTLKIGV
jgi:hypothetical protein